MIISMKLHSSREEIEQVTDIVRHFGYKVHSIEGEERVVIGVVGVGDVTACMESVESLPQVEKVVRITAPYKFVSKEFRKGKTRIRVNGTEIGGDEFVVAGQFSIVGIEIAANRLQLAAEEHNLNTPRKFPLSFSIGHVTMEPYSQESLKDLVTRADEAMYKEKRRKKVERK